jgi:hypothetical protein
MVFPSNAQRRIDHRRPRAALSIFIVCDLLFFSVLARRPLSGFYGTL